MLNLADDDFHSNQCSYNKFRMIPCNDWRIKHKKMLTNEAQSCLDFFCRLCNVAVSQKWMNGKNLQCNPSILLLLVIFDTVVK